MKIEINNSQKTLRPDLPQLRRLIEFFAAKMQKVRPDKQWHHLSILLTGDAGIRSVHWQFLGSNTSTDVISFHLPPLPGEPDLDSAEIIVNTQRAQTEGRRPGRQSPARELALYLAHACNHLLGETDARPHERTRMRRRELRWLREADTRNRIANILKSV